MQQKCSKRGLTPFAALFRRAALKRENRNQPQFEILRDAGHPDFREAMVVYSAAFPVHERRDEGTIERRVRDGFYVMHMGRLGGRVVFLALIHELAGTEFGLLDYMATERSARGRGIGRAFLRGMSEELRKQGRYFILEVEDPARGENRAERARRHDFYRREGAVEMLGAHYVMPVKPGHAPEKMLLMVLPRYGDGMMRGAVARRIITSIYLEVYGRDESDPLLNSFINDIPSSVTLA